MATPAPVSAGSTGVFADWRERHSSSLGEARHSLRIFLRDRAGRHRRRLDRLHDLRRACAPWIAPYPAEGRGASHLASRFEAPSAQHLFGTDNLGRDVLSRVIFGARIPLMISSAVALAVLLIGPLLGALAGYFGGWLDEIIMRITDIFLALPRPGPRHGPCGHPGAQPPQPGHRHRRHLVALVHAPRARHGGLVARAALC